MNPSFRRLAARALAAASLCIGLAGAAAAQDKPPRTLAVTGFELIEDQPNPAQAGDLARRLAAADRQLREGLDQMALYRVVDPSAAQPTIARLKTQHEYLYRCGECPQAIGRAAGADLVLVGWVQKVSELILNLNVELHESATGRVVLSKSVDMRGNNDESWARAVRFMLRDWAERRARNPAYGQ